MKKMDEMDRNIRLRSEELGYKVLLLALSLWIIYESWQSFMNGQSIFTIPTFILILSLCVQGFSEMYMKRKMIEGDDEYKEPNKVLWSIIAIIVVVALVISLGLTFYMRVR